MLQIALVKMNDILEAFPINKFQRILTEQYLDCVGIGFNGAGPSEKSRPKYVGVHVKLAYVSAELLEGIPKGKFIMCSHLDPELG